MNPGKLAPGQPPRLEGTAQHDRSRGAPVLPAVSRVTSIFVKACRRSTAAAPPPASFFVGRDGRAPAERLEAARRVVEPDRVVEALRRRQMFGGHVERAFAAFRRESRRGRSPSRPRPALLSVRRWADLGARSCSFFFSTRARRAGGRAGALGVRAARRPPLSRITATTIAATMPPSSSAPPRRELGSGDGRQPAGCAGRPPDRRGLRRSPPPRECSGARRSRAGASCAASFLRPYPGRLVGGEIGPRRHALGHAALLAEQVVADLLATLGGTAAVPWRGRPALQELHGPGRATARSEMSSPPAPARRSSCAGPAAGTAPRAWSGGSSSNVLMVGERPPPQTMRRSPAAYRGERP